MKRSLSLTTDCEDNPCKKFKTSGRDYCIQFNDLLNELHTAFDRIIDRVTSGPAPNDMVRLILTINHILYPISLPFMPQDQLTSERCCPKFNEWYSPMRIIVSKSSKVSKTNEGAIR